ncbi:MAG: ABC transporter permease subunit [Thermoanaerobacteraceae bacterium]|nr:ABC transporter permease subunit [Thermoanaerobacteraceae bacterium]
MVLSESWKNFREGLADGLLPLLGKEIRGRSRSWRFPLLLSIYLALLSGGILTFLWLNRQVSQFFLQTGLLLYGLFACGLVLLLAFIAAAVAATAISGERERRTYDLLLVTAASPAGIILGKWLSSVVYLLLLVVAALPLLAVVYLFGGVPLVTLGKALLLSLFAGLGYGAVGLAYSAVLKRSQAAIIFSLVTVFALIFGTLIIAGIVAASQRQPGPVPPPPPGKERAWYIYLSPLSALPDILPQNGVPVPIAGELINISRHLAAGAAGVYYEESPFGTPATLKPGWPAWARFTVYQSLLTLISLFTAALAVNPLPPWRKWQLLRGTKEPPPKKD